MPLKVGDEAPDIALPYVPGEAPLRLSDYLDEKPVVLLFLPPAFSEACTEEMREAAGEYDRWAALGAEVVAISVDSPFVNQKFGAELDVPFPILSDFNRKAIDAFGVRDNAFFGLEGVAHRSAFVLSPEGRIAYAWVSGEPSGEPSGEASGETSGASRILPDFEEVARAVRECR